MSAVLPTSHPVATLASTPADAVVAQLPVPFKSEERLRLSRERMRLYLESARGGPQSSRLADRALRSGWLASLRSHPAMSASFDAVSTWWARHPLRIVAAIGGGLLQPRINARARQRPVAVLSLAVLAGAVVVWARPWRWLFRPALVMGLFTQVAKRVVKEMPLDSMLKMVSAFTPKSAVLASRVRPESNIPVARSR